MIHYFSKRRKNYPVEHWALLLNYYLCLVANSIYGLFDIVTCPHYASNLSRDSMMRDQVAFVPPVYD